MTEGRADHRRPPGGLGARLRAFLVRRRVPLSYLGALVYLVFARPSLPTLAAGAVLMVAGEAVRLWASGHIEKNVRVARTGPYAHVRHPLYVGSGLIGLGLAVASGHLVLAVAVVAAVALLLGLASRAEEVRLVELFGDEYRAYRRDVPAFVPRLRPLERGGRFDWRALKRHRELRAVAGLVAGLALLALKARLW